LSVFDYFCGVQTISNMKKTITMALFLLMAQGVSAQATRDSVRVDTDGVYDMYYVPARKPDIPDGVKDVHLYTAGLYQRRSATCETAAWMAVALSGVAYSGVAFKDRTTCNIVGISLNIAAGILFGSSLYYRFKSGAEMKMSAAGLRVTF
jgi:hypothetical protein